MNPPLWVFGYGSLMWRPGFFYSACHHALLSGYARAFCRLSTRHRGTREAPGMVLGLVPGADCQGLAFALAPSRQQAVLEYLDEREGAGYLRRKVRLELGEPIAAEQPLSRCAPQAVWAWTYLSDPTHPSHVPHLPLAQMAALIAAGVGESGTARDYLRLLLEQFQRLEIKEPQLQLLYTQTEILAKNANNA